MKKIVIAVVLLSVFVAGLWFIALPAAQIIDILEGSFKKDHIYLKTEGFKKGLFYNFSAERVLIKEKSANEDSETPLLIFQDVNVRFEFISLFRLSPEVSFNCRIGHGVVAGKVGLTGKKSLEIKGDDINVNDIPFFESLGIYGDGILSGNYLFHNKKGELKLSVNDARLKDTYLAGVFLPMNLFNDIKGVMTINDDTVEVGSLAMSGKGVYGRVKGGIKANHMDLSLELMTDSSYATGAIPLAILEQYKISPGYYVIPLKGDIPNTRGE